MNKRGSFAFRTAKSAGRAFGKRLSSRSVLTYSVSFWLGTRTRAAVRTFGIFTPLLGKLLQQFLESAKNLSASAPSTTR